MFMCLRLPQSSFGQPRPAIQTAWLAVRCYRHRKATDAPDEHGVPGQHRSAPRGDGDEAGQDPIAQRAWLCMVGRTWLVVLEPYIGQGRC